MFAVGEAGTILRCDGGIWASMESGTAETLVGVWGTSDRNVYTIGVDGGAILRGIR
jgi:hypothetical protein